MPVTASYLEDFAVGQTFGSGRLRIDEEQIRRFAREFDPQPFHLNDEAARDTIFRGLAASGWHTAALTMRLLVEGDLKPAGGIIGAAIDELRWPRPVRPDDELRVESEVLEVRPSKSRPEQGMIKVRSTTLNEGGQAVQIFVGNLVVPRKSPAQP
jgi:acyl dehydratase